MNYYSPYFGYAPYAAAPASRGILSGILGSIRGANWSGWLSNIQKTLGVVNQAIPMVKQVSPMIGNAKTMFKIMNEFKKVDTPTTTTSQNNTTATNTTSSSISNNENQVTTTQYDNQPTFFIQ